MKREIWKPVLGYINLYEVSNLGRVRSLNYNRTGKTKILKPGKNSYGYLQVQLWKDGIAKMFKVHRLVWEAFNGEIPEGMEVNHINEDKTDNRYPENLNLMSPMENCNWGTRNQKIKEKLSDSVLQLTPDDELVKEWPSMNEAGRNGFSIGSISMCCNSKIKKYRGFKWMKKLPLC